MTFSPSLLLILICTLYTTHTIVEGFQVLPYVHIDYEHYYRLAQCQAQCAEKYGTVAYRRRLDGSTRSYINTTNAHYNMCQLGCQNARMATTPAGNRQRSVGDDAFRDGQQFWLSAAQGVPARKSTIASTQPHVADRSPVAALRILCLKAAASAQANGYLDTYSALLSAQPHKSEFLAPVRYLLQWKQRIPLNGQAGKEGQQRFDETKWITASIEPDSTFTAEGLQPGVQYRFMVTVIATSGRMGATVTSDWIEAPPLGAPMPTVPLPLVVTPQFNSDDNVSAVVSFRREGTSTKRMTIATTCAYRLRYTNSSLETYSFEFEMDESEGHLLPNLAFNTPYELEIHPLSAPQSSNSTHLDSLGGAISTARFRTVACADVYGSGSLRCDPEPVQDLDIRLNNENSTVLLTWKPSTETRHVLLYELRTVPISDKGECPLDEATMYLPAKATQAELSLPLDSRCEVEVCLINFDLRGREASITARFIYNPEGNTRGDNSTTFLLIDQLSTNLWIIVLAPVLVILTLVCVLRFAATGQRRLKKKVGGMVRGHPSQGLTEGKTSVDKQLLRGPIGQGSVMGKGPINV